MHNVYNLKCAVVDLNEIYQFQGFHRIIVRNRMQKGRCQADRQTDRQTDSIKTFSALRESIIKSNIISTSIHLSLALKNISRNEMK